MKMLAATLLAVAFGLSTAHAQQATAPIPPPPSAVAPLPPRPPVPPVADTAAPTDPIAAPVAAYVPPVRHRRHHVVLRREAPAAGERRETQALNILEAQGDGDFSDLHRTGRNYTATVNQNGNLQTVVVDPRSGEIRNIQ